MVSKSFLKKKGMKIGFGAIGKGYAADKAKALLQEQGVAAGIINASGDVLAECQRGQHDAWVQHTIDLNTNRQSGRASIPKRLLPRFSYFLADTVFPLSSLSTYKKGLSKTLHSTEE